MRDNLPTALPFNFFSPARLLFGNVMGALPLVDSEIGVWLYGGLFGIADGMQHALLGSAYAHYFGRLHHGTIRGLSNTPFYRGARFIGGTAIGPDVLALGPDILGGFAPILWILAPIPLLLGIAAFAGWLADWDADVLRRESP